MAGCGPFPSLKRIESELAKQRQQAAGRFAGKDEFGNPKVQVPVRLPEAEDTGDARDKAAAYVGMSGRTAEKAKERQRAAGKEYGRGQEKVPEPVPEPIVSSEARDEAGKLFHATFEEYCKERQRAAGAANLQRHHEEAGHKVEASLVVARVPQLIDEPAPPRKAAPTGPEIRRQSSKRGSLCDKPTACTR